MAEVIPGCLMALALAAGAAAPVDERALAAQEATSRAAHRDTAQRDADKMGGHPAWADEDRRAAGGKDPEHAAVEKRHAAAIKRLQKEEAAHRKVEARHAALEKKHQKSARGAAADHKKMAADHERLIADHERVRKELDEIVTEHESMLKSHGKAQIP